MRQIHAAVTHLSPLPLVMLTSFSMPPVSARALAFSMFLLVTSCRVQQIAARVSSDNKVVFPPWRRLTRSLIAYFPGRAEGKGDTVNDLHIFQGRSLCRKTGGENLPCILAAIAFCYMLQKRISARMKSKVNDNHLAWDCSIEVGSLPKWHCFARTLSSVRPRV